MGWNDGSLYAGRQPPAARILIRKAGRANTGAGYRTYGYPEHNTHASVDGKDYLMHHGISGMKWGQRRYQYENGKLTPEGKIRYAKESEPESKSWKKSDSKNLSDEELNRRNSRLQREQNYENLMTTGKERARKQFSDDFKKKVLTAALITPVVAIVGVAAKKYMGSATSKVGGLLSKFGKTAVQKIKTGNLLKQAASRGHEKYMKQYPHDGKGFLQARPNELDRTFDFVKREPPLWRRKVIT